jgi:phosphatidylglycerol:prolipoprotein diacylglycerol transferase
MPRSGMVTALFAILYGLFRFLVEFVREPEVSNVFDLITMGQLLSGIMILGGAALLWLRGKAEE